MAKITTSQFEKGMFIEFKDEPHQIVEFQHVNPGKGSAFIRTKLKSLKSGKVQEFTYKSGESVEEIPINVFEMQYLYKTGDEFFFMDKGNFEQLAVDKNIVGNFANFIKEGEIYQILIHEDAAVGMRFPKKVRIKVTASDEAVKGNTVSGAKKVVTIETGVQITVPLFIKKGDTIAIDPETGVYLERVGQT
ncbi:elongation factor P [Candidatus Gottesmanbacteria bacterium]|nr:elongation factor P [Candidatus Gottesmanbacteria bacterium]